ncbi:MAG: TatD family hydrolase [Bacteroidales bacterium]|nr:TatD family hydrolase [Bacteroidales bacterium]
MEWIDTHTHAYDEAFAGCEDEIVARAVRAGVGVQLQADVDARERDRMYALVERHPGVLRPMLGLYPGSVDRDWRRGIDALEAWRSRGPVAVGEIGLDYHYGTEFKAEQQEAFRVQLELAAAWDLPVNIHLRDATEDFFRIMADCTRLHLRGNLHAFSGSAETFRRLQRLGGDWYVGIGGVVTFKNAAVAQAVKRIPLDRILLETDAPYLTPVPHRGERNESAYLPLIGAFVAQLKGVSPEEVAATTTANAKRLFAI